MRTERPIPFSAPMVRAILSGQKTVTRRVVKGCQIPKEDTSEPIGARLRWTAVGQHDPRYGFIVAGSTADECAAELASHGVCPYGRRSERLWVRETCFINDYRQAGVPVDERAGIDVVYRADPLPDWEGEESLITWRPSIHMPRWASRILLEITDVRVERLHDITEEQALAEGVMSAERDIDPDGNDYSPLELFGGLWVKLNGMDSWSANPWVWVVEFRRITP